MAITLKQLQEHLPLPEEQEDFAHQANVAITRILSYFTQQFQEAIKPSVSHLFGQKGYFNEYFKECFAGLMQKTFGVDERYLKPAYIPSPPYVRQSQPRIIYVYVYNLPGLN